MRSPAALPLALIAAFTLAHPAAAEKDKWSAWLDAGAFYNNHDDGRGEVTLWAPLDHTSDSVTFLDVRGRLFDAGELEGNLAFGYREQRDGWNLGLWAGFDIRRSSLDSAFPQVSGGVEALSQDWDIRVNGYLPLDDSNVVSTSSVTVDVAPTILLDGNSILLQTGSSTTTSTLTELAFGGFDGEIGLRAPIELLDVDPKKLDLRLYGGGFHFDNGDAPKSISGPKARLELRINDVIDTLPGSRLTLEAEYTDDDVRGDRSEFGLRLRIPLGDTSALASTAPQDLRMSEGLRRDTDVVASSQMTSTTTDNLTTEAVKDGLTGVTFDRVAYMDGTSPDLTAFAAARGANTLIIAQGGNGNLTGGNLVPAQTIVGGGGTIDLQGTTTGTTFQFIAPGSQPTLDLPVSSNQVLALASNTHVTGLKIDIANGVSGIALNHGSTGIQLSNIVVDDNTIVGGANSTAIVTHSPIASTSATNITIANNTITGGFFAINAFDASNINITNNLITGVNGGISVGSLNFPTYSNVSITQNTIDALLTANYHGVQVFLGAGTQIDISNNTIAATYTLEIKGSGSSGTISNNSLNAPNGIPMIYAVGVTGNVFTGSGNTALNPSAPLCQWSPGNSLNIQFVGGGTCP